MIGNKIKELRKSRKLTLEKLAHELNSLYPGTVNFNKGKISKWENEKEEPRLSSLKIISDYFNVPLDYFNDNFQGEEIKNYNDPQKEKLISNYDELNDDNKKELVNISSDMLEEQKQAEIIKIDKKFLEVARQAVAFDGKEFSDKEIEAIAQVLKENFNNDDL